MKNTIRTIAIYLLVLFLLASTVVVINQTIQFADFMDRFHPLAGEITFWGLIVLYAVFLSAPLIVYFKLPKRVPIPLTEEGEEFEEYLRLVGYRLSQNKSLEETSFSTREEIEAGMKELDGRCMELVKTAGSRTFLFTAISQFGALDTMMVMATQTRMIWDIAHLYNQRPTLQDLWFLYSNVIATAFISGEVNDIDFAEVVQPVISKTLGSAGSVIPGTTLFINSVFTGTTNAYLMLRVGIITRNYCHSLVKQERSFIRRNALTESASLLSTIALEGAKKLSGTVVKATGKSMANVVTGAGKSIVDTGKKIVKGFSRGTSEG